LTTQIEATLGQILVGTCDYDEALQLMGAAVAAKRERARPGSGMAVGSAYTLACIGSVHADRGDFNAAHAAFEEAVRLLGETTHPVGNSVRNWIAVAHISEGQWAKAQKVAQESVRIAEGTHTLLLLAVSRSTLAYARWREGGDDEAVRQLEQAVGWMAARHGRMFTGLHSAWLAEACVATGRDAQARQLAAHVLRRARQGERLGEGIACRAMARQAHGSGQTAAVQRWLSRAQASADVRQSCRETALNETLRAELS
jgi:tetratricopeptide (TPR) repeat protein